MNENISAPKSICIATGTRADWGLLSPLAKALASRDDCRVTVAATNMHLDPRFGLTVNDIIADGFTPERVAMPAGDDSEASRAKAMAACLEGFAELFGRLQPDMVVILGDRYEMLAVASAAAVMRIPIVHIAGGTVSEGAVDESIRHAITKLAALHLAETEQYRRRIIAMGENPARVFNTGAIGVWNIHNVPLIPLEQLSADLDFALDKPYAIATFHPATLDPTDPAERCRAMLDALDRHTELNLIITYPNNDARSSGIIELIERYAADRPGRVKLVKSLGLRRYLSAMRSAAFVIGNSSSGIVEVASFGIPSIDIGCRQRGRACAESVIHCGNSADEIDDAICLALSPDFRNMAAHTANPYDNHDTLSLMVKAICEADPKALQHKSWFDNKC